MPNPPNPDVAAGAEALPKADGWPNPDVAAGAEALPKAEVDNAPALGRGPLLMTGLAAVDCPNRELAFGAVEPSLDNANGELLTGLLPKSVFDVGTLEKGAACVVLESAAEDAAAAAVKRGVLSTHPCSPLAGLGLGPGSTSCPSSLGLLPNRDTGDLPKAPSVGAPPATAVELDDTVAVLK